MEKLRVYQSALDLIAQIYLLSRITHELSRDYSLVDQIKRAAISIAANIAEGYCRTGKEFRNYLRIASGSANEVVALLQIIDRVHSQNTLELQEEFKHLGRQINALSKQIDN